MMRNRLLLLIYILLHCFVVRAQVMVEGTIRNYDGNTTIHYAPTIEGVLFSTKEIKPSPSGNFRIFYRNEGVGTLRLHYKGISYAFIHTERTHITLIIDDKAIDLSGLPGVAPGQRDVLRHTTKQSATVSINGDLADLNRFYNRSLRSSTRPFTVDGCDLAHLIYNTQTPEQAMYTIDSLRQTELDALALVYSTNAPGNERDSSTPAPLKPFIEDQINAFYADVFLSAMMLKRVEQSRRLLLKTDSTFSLYNPVWEVLTEHFIRNAARMIKPAANTEEFNSFLLNVIYTTENYKKYDFEPPTLSEDELVIEKLLSTDPGVADSFHLLDENALFAYRLHNMTRFLYSENYFSPVLLRAIDSMTTVYSGSEHLVPFDAQIKKLNAYVKDASKKFEGAKVLSTNYLQFSDLVQSFAGTFILVDIWATWCAPCQQDLVYKNTLKEFTNNGKLVILYISIDKPSWEKRWRENIRFNQLEGYHVLANEQLIVDMWDTLKTKPGVIPRYVLIDDQGRIVNADASRPGDGDKLRKEISMMLETDRN